MKDIWFSTPPFLSAQLFLSALHPVPRRCPLMLEPRPAYPAVALVPISSRISLPRAFLPLPPTLGGARSLTLKCSVRTRGIRLRNPGFLFPIPALGVVVRATSPLRPHSATFCSKSVLPGLFPFMQTLFATLVLKLGLLLRVRTIWLTVLGIAHSNSRTPSG